MLTAGMGGIHVFNCNFLRFCHVGAQYVFGFKCPSHSLRQGLWSFQMYKRFCFEMKFYWFLNLYGSQEC